MRRASQGSDAGATEKGGRVPGGDAPETGDAGAAEYRETRLDHLAYHVAQMVVGEKDVHRIARLILHQLRYADDLAMRRQAPYIRAAVTAHEKVNTPGAAAALERAMRILRGLPFVAQASEPVSGDAPPEPTDG